MATGFAGSLAARLFVAGRGLDAGLTPDDSGQREATTADDAFASGAFARAASFDAGAIAGQGVFGPSLRLVCEGSSARALATECCVAGSACGAGGFGGGEIFRGAACESLSPSSRRYQQWRLGRCSMR